MKFNLNRITWNWVSNYLPLLKFSVLIFEFNCNIWDSEKKVGKGYGILTHYDWRCASYHWTWGYWWKSAKRQYKPKEGKPMICALWPQYVQYNYLHHIRKKMKVKFLSLGSGVDSSNANNSQIGNINEWNGLVQTGPLCRWEPILCLKGQLQKCEPRVARSEFSRKARYLDFFVISALVSN